MAQEESNSDNVEFFVFHGATDAPAVDVIARDVATLVDNAAYTEMTGLYFCTSCILHLRCNSG